MEQANMNQPQSSEISKEQYAFCTTFSVVPKNYLLLVYIIVCGLLSGVVFGDTITKYHSLKGEFSISVPSTWKRDTATLPSGLEILQFSSPKEDRTSFIENVNIIVTANPGISISELHSRGIELCKKNMPLFELIDQGSCQIGSQPAMWHESIFAYEGNMVKMIKYILINGDKCYLITGVALPETYDLYRPLFRTIASSIVFDNLHPSTKNNSQPSNPDDNITAWDIGYIVGVICGIILVLRSRNFSRVLVTILNSLTSLTKSNFLAMLCHLFGLFPVVGTVCSLIIWLIIWLLKKNNDQFLSDQVKEALNWQITMILAYIALFILTFVGVFILNYVILKNYVEWFILIFLFISLFLFFVLNMLNMILPIIGSAKAYSGLQYRYPFCIKLIK